MGRRSINTTKSGKYMNPTDQARKEARKQELKKNKKQRQLVRAAVLKGKDPQQLLEELEKIDQMEYNVNQPSPLNEKVLRDKRKKLRDTLDRVLSMYYKDDQEKWTELRKRQTEYETKRNQLMAFFESVKSAQSVTIDEIPLPQLPQALNQSLQIPLPLPAIDIPTAVLKKPEHVIYSIAAALKMQAMGKPPREPPGCPFGPPIDIDSDGELEPCYWPNDSSNNQSHLNNNSDNSDDDHSDISDHEDEQPLSNEPNDQTNMSDNDAPPSIHQITDNSANQVTSILGKPPTAAKPTSLQQKMVALSGQNVDEFMREMEEQQAKLRLLRQGGVQNRGGTRQHNRDGGSDGGDDSESDDEGNIDPRRGGLGLVNMGHIESPAPPGTELGQGLMADMMKGVQAMQGSQIRPPFAFPGVRLPPGPPPGRPPLMPPGPPPGLPPPRLMHPPPLRIQPPPPAIAAAAAAAAAARLGVRIPGPPGISAAQPSSAVAAAHAAHAAAVAAINNLASAAQGIQLQSAQSATPNVVSAAPQLIRQDGSSIAGGPGVSDKQQSATISAKPQIRNLSADVTRFVPSALRVKRDNDRSKLGKAQTSSARASLVHELKQKELAMMSQASGTGQQPTKDDAYMQFMKEMQGLL